MKQFELPVGLLFSISGPYHIVSSSMRNGALLACQEINANPKSQVRIAPINADPGGDLRGYISSAEMMMSRGVRHIVGCYTSSSRKEVMPVIEKRDGLLWYPCHYEGFERADCVVYTGAAPNHHIQPLIDFLVSDLGRTTFCVASNYIWGWETIRVVREELQKKGGVITGEHYAPVGEKEMSKIIDKIFEKSPDFIFNALIGESSYAFFRQFRAACEARGVDQAKRFPIASCNLTEPELEAIGKEAAAGHFSSSVYFSSLPGRRNEDFIAAYQKAFPDGPLASAEAEAAYIAVSMLARAVEAAGSDDVAAVRAILPQQLFAAPQGAVRIDADTFHAYLTPRIGRSRSDFRFDILREAAKPVRPDPYLINSSPPLELAVRVPPKGAIQ